MIDRRVFLKQLAGVSVGALIGESIWPLAADAAETTTGMQKRWLFIFKDLTDPKQVNNTIALLPRAKTDGYNAIVINSNVMQAKAADLRKAAKDNGLGLVVMVMGGASDRNYYEGFHVVDALYVASGGTASLAQDNPTKVANADFEDVSGNHFNGWSFQDSEGSSTFADHDVVHGGKTSLRMENVGQNPGQHCRIMQTVQLSPRRQYRMSFWVKTQDMAGGMSPSVELLTPDGNNNICWESFHCDSTQDWKHYDLTFNSLQYTSGLLYLGTWGGTTGKFWWDDFEMEEIGLVNALRRPGCPLSIKGDDGTVYSEGQDYNKVTDPMLNPWWSYHDQPLIHLTANTKIKEGERLRVSYYHSVIVYEDRINNCLSEPKVFADWETEVKNADALLHPDAFFMQHDEIREANQCAACQAMQMTPGELLAWNIRKAAAIIRKVRPDASIWVWNDMFDPYHNAKEKDFYFVNGPLTGSWKGLDKDVGIVNWNGGGLDKDCQFFADLGLKQILSGYYDGDDDGSGIANWEAKAKDIKGIVGAMYTTWNDNYAPMDVWAKKAWGG